MGISGLQGPDGSDCLPEAGYEIPSRLGDRFEILPHQKSLASRGTGKPRKLTCVDSASFVRSKR